MIARVADHCFWLGRYLERTESSARVLDVTLSLALDTELSPEQCWRPAIIVAGQEADFLQRYGPKAMGDGETVQTYAVLDRGNWVSLRRSIGAARDNARSIRDVLSLDVWEVINELYVFLSTGEAEAAFEENRSALYGRVQRSVQLVFGLMRSTMLHDAPLDFVWLGLLLERVSQTARLLDVHHHAQGASGARDPALETALWLSFLRACSGVEGFMKRSRGRMNEKAVAGFLMLESRFPRSLRYCAVAARERLEAIASDGEFVGTAALHRLRRLEEILDTVPPDGPDGARVHEVLTQVVQEVHGACDCIGQELLGGTSKPLTEMRVAS